MRFYIRVITIMSAAVMLFASCSEHKVYGEEGYYYSEYNKLYSNRSIAGYEAGELKLSYLNGGFPEKDVYFQLTDKNTAMLKLSGFIAGEKETVITGIPLTKSSTGGYTFSTETLTDISGTKIGLTGSVSKEGLTLNIGEVQVPSNALTEFGKFEMMPYRVLDMLDYTDNDGTFHSHYAFSFVLEWFIRNADGEKERLLASKDGDTDLTAMAQGFIGSLLYLMLPSVTFHPDGNLTAEYAPLREGLLDNVMNILYFMLGAVPEDWREPATASPKNQLITYNVVGEKLYVKPSLPMIMSMIGDIKISGDNMPAMNLMEMIRMVLELYPSLNRWMTEGIAFHFIRNNIEDPVYPIANMDFVECHYFGDYQIYLDEKELAPVISLLPMILDLVGIDFNEIDLGAIGSFLQGIDDIFEKLAGNAMQNTTELNIRLILSKTNPDLLQ